MQKRKENHVPNAGKQMQELEDKIKKELEKSGAIEISFEYGKFNEREPPRFSYRLRKGYKNPLTCPLATKIRNRLCRNFSSNVYDISPGEDIRTIDGNMVVVYTETLLMTPEKVRETYQFKKKILSSFLNELINYNRT
ncbi:hypothetical protein J4429_06370 [Candidatus Pacearchaeota archaeon]|nr:hypothetical protein [Candidatus Pacearchaeota archaeon]